MNRTVIPIKGNANGAWIVVVVAMLTIFATGCGEAVRNTITQQQAEQRVEENYRMVLALLPKEARPALQVGDIQPCDDPTDDGPRGRVIASVSYQVRDLQAADFNAHFDAIKQWWTDHNFRILDDSRPKNMYLWAENNGDGFRMALQANDVGGFYIISTSPCVWPEGTPAPQN